MENNFFKNMTLKEIFKQEKNFLESSPDEIADSIKLKIFELADFKKEEFKNLIRKQKIDDFIGRL
jgi:hypothetical protein